MDQRLPIALGVALLSGCSWVTLTPEAKDVRLVTEAQAADCKKLGQTTVSLVDKVAGIRRNEEKVKEELATLARNSAAADLKGNAVAPVSPVEEGKQTFAVYRCPGS